MKILHAAETIRGGVATVIRHHLEFQCSLPGSDVTVLAPEDQIADLQDCAEFRGCGFKRGGRDLISYYRFVKAFLSIVRDQRPDVVHLHSTFAGLLGRISLLYLRASGIGPRVIYCPHGWAFLMQGGALKKCLYGIVERMLVPLTDKIICVSRYETVMAKRHGITGEKLVTIYNGIVPTARPDRQDITAAELKILFVGRLDHQKGFDVVLNVMRSLEGKAYHLSVVGEAVQAMKNSTSRSNITFKGWMSHRDVMNNLASADVLLMPSRWEGFGLAAAEAAMQECPAIVTNCCSLPEIVLDRATGFLVPPGDDAAITNLLENTPRDEWREMGVRARAHVLENFSLDTMVRATLETYQSS